MSVLATGVDGLDAVLAEGVTRGLISPEQAEGLAGIARGDAAAIAPPAEDERLRLVTGFADIFVTLGIALFLGAAAWLASGSAAGGPALVAGLAWALAEFFTRRRRMALPSIALLVVFTYAAFAALLAGMVGRGGLLPGLDVLAPGGGKAGLAALAALATAGLVALHYLRFRVPITVAAGVAALLGAALACLAALAPAFTSEYRNALFVLAGLVAFALAMRFDLADPSRTTRAADIAFWLHLLAAPLVVHPLLSRFAAPGAAPTPGAALAVLAVFLGLAVAALVVDRRAMLVSGLVYAGIAFGTLVRQAGISDQTVPLTVLALGAFVLLISAGWRPLRGLALGALPAAVAARLPHPQGAS